MSTGDTLRVRNLPCTRANYLSPRLCQPSFPLRFHFRPLHRRCYRFPKKPPMRGGAERPRCRHPLCPWEVSMKREGGGGGGGGGHGRSAVWAAAGGKLLFETSTPTSGGNSSKHPDLRRTEIKTRHRRRTWIASLVIVVIASNLPSWGNCA